jgi:hypothetical protein
MSSSHVPHWFSSESISRDSGTSGRIRQVIIYKPYSRFYLSVVPLVVPARH